MNYASMSKKELRKEAKRWAHIVHSEAIAELYEWIRTRRMEKEMDRLQRQQFDVELLRTGIPEAPYEEAYAAWRKVSGVRIHHSNNVPMDAFGREMHLPVGLAYGPTFPIDPNAAINIMRMGAGPIVVKASFKGPQYWPRISSHIQETLNKEYQG